MTEYILLAVIVLFIYFVLVRNRAPAKTDWETLPLFEAYQKMDKAKNPEGQLCCQYCGHTETVKRDLNSEKENPLKNKHYHACTNCKVVLWRSEEQ